jgi:hypothetical protein
VTVNIEDDSSAKICGYMIVKVNPNEFWGNLKQKLINQTIENSVFKEKIVKVGTVKCGGKTVVDHKAIPDCVKVFYVVATCELGMLIFGVFCMLYNNNK